MPGVRELRATDLRCRAHGCGAGPGELCNGTIIMHAERVDDFAQLASQGWEWQEIEPDDRGAADRRRQFCSKDAWCTRTAGHRGECETEVKR